MTDSRRTPEQVLALVLSAWREALGTDAPVGADTDLFDAGGDSMVASQIAFALSEELGLDEPAEADLIVAMFDGRTPAQLATALADGSVPR